METMGVRGIGGLEQLERTGISTWKCGLILIGGLVAFNSTMWSSDSNLGS